jgi:hypothetical protein
LSAAAPRRYRCCVDSVSPSYWTALLSRQAGAASHWTAPIAGEEWTPGDAAWRRLDELRSEFGDEIDRFEIPLRIAEGAGLPAITDLDTFRAGLARFVAWLDKPRPRRARG